MVKFKKIFKKFLRSDKNEIYNSNSDLKSVKTFLLAFDEHHIRFETYIFVLKNEDLIKKLEKLYFERPIDDVSEDCLLNLGPVYYNRDHDICLTVINDDQFYNLREAVNVAKSTTTDYDIQYSIIRNIMFSSKLICKREGIVKG